ncbi:N-acetylneuraminate synthase family protein [Akkermansiaceae bacterium]|nr:N-acetylneuraminate synthase family protein [Akkermansiaceae bacterium]
MELAKELIHVAAYFCKVDVVKFQKRNSRELLSEEEYNAPHPNPMHSYGKTYGEHREFLEFDLAQHKILKSWCEEGGVDYCTSVWDLTSAKEIVGISPKLIKIPSACNLNFEMLEYLCNEFKGEIHLSFGMTTHDEEEEIVRLFESKGAAEQLILYSCTSGYPVAFDDICLLEISRLKEAFDDRVKEIGFSGHHLGIAADLAAMTLGATWVERHFTLDRTWKGTDHAASLEPDGMRRLCRDLSAVSESLAYKSKEILDVEAVQRAKLKRSRD